MIVTETTLQPRVETRGDKLYKSIGYNSIFSLFEERKKGNLISEETLGMVTSFIL